jgi:hypothetical protein
VKLTGPSRVLLVRYEDLCKHPGKELLRIGRYLGVNLSEVVDKIEKGEPFAVGHGLAGNRIRRQGDVVFDSSTGGKRILPRRYAFLVWIFCWPLLLRYRYGIKSCQATAPRNGIS